jgi:hypothetical protein
LPKVIEDIREVMRNFVAKVKMRKGIEGDHSKSEEAHKEFYDTLENGLCGIAHHLLTQPQRRHRPRSRFCRLSTHL